MKNGLLKSFADSKKIKYGTVNIAFTAIVIAIVIVVNTIVSSLSESLGWYLDMTEEQLYTVSDGLANQLDQISNDIKIDVIFCTSEDKAEKHYADVSRGEALAYVHSTAEQLAKRYSFINISYHDPLREYDFFNKNFTKTDNQIAPNENTVIIARRGEDGTYGTHYRIYSSSSFYVFKESDGGIYGYNGEKVFASAVLALTHDVSPVVYFTWGHGEHVLTKTESGQRVTELMNLFVYSGFSALPLDLNEKEFTCTCGAIHLSSDINQVAKDGKLICSKCAKTHQLTDVESAYRDRAIPEDARMIIINDPQNDFEAEEIAKLRKYLDGQGNVMCFTDYKASLPAFYEFLSSWAGVSVKGSGAVTDPSTSTLSEPLLFRGSIASTNAAQIYLSGLNNLASARPIFKDSGILEIDSRYSSGEGINVGNATRYTLPLVYTSSGASFGGVRGQHTVMSVTSSHTIKNNDDAYAYLVVCPSAQFASDDYLASSAYPNSNMILSLIHSMTAYQTPVNVDIKAFESYALDITASQARVAMICLVTILPAIVAVCCAVVIIRRKRR
ncbi:MAG: Gldg family protein [Clostridia bacterium]|nr:Gldg family protein [Clostridia bacterium]